MFRAKSEGLALTQPFGCGNSALNSVRLGFNLPSLKRHQLFWLNHTSRPKGRHFPEKGESSLLPTKLLSLLYQTNRDRLSAPSNKEVPLGCASGFRYWYDLFLHFLPPLHLASIDRVIEPQAYSNKG